MSPITSIVVTLALLAIFIAALIIWSRMRRGQARALRQAFAAAAAARGWSYVEQDGRAANAFGAKPFRRGVRRRPAALDVVSGTIGGQPATAFRYRYTRGTNPDTLADVYSWFTVCALRPAGRPSAPPRISGATCEIDGDWIVCWSRGARTRPDVVFARIEALAASVDPAPTR